ncbi:hypothetical protein G9A89_014077 [Geosiphon pyriformis]|nr:hypothetical protein G9A89_014077 [Geosiphon pyriformis]
MSFVLGEPNYFKYVSSLRHYGVAFVDQLHDKHDAVFSWTTFKCGEISSSACFLPLNVSFDILRFYDFGVICNSLLHVNAAHFFVYTDGSLSGLGTSDVMTGAAVFFEDINLGLGVGVSGLVSSIMVELQAIALALECILSSCSVNLFLDSQAALDACKSESVLAHLDFRNQYWVECYHITNVICHKNLNVNWIKVKDHSGVFSNEHADAFARAAAFSNRHLPYMVGSGSCVLMDSLCANINWSRSLLVWHSDSYLAAGFTSTHTASLCSYFIKALHHCLPVICYPSVMCLFCGDVEISDHVFSCLFDTANHAQLIELLHTCVSDLVVGTALFKGFVFDNWYHESVLVFKDPKIAAQNIVIMEKSGLISQNGSVSVSVFGFSVVLSAGVIKLLGVADTFGISFGFHKSCPFFSDIENMVFVYISV